MSSVRKPPPPAPEDDEEMMVEDEDEEDEDVDMGMDMFEALGSLLATEDGDTVATSLQALSNSAEKIADNLEMQNKILVKIAATLNKLVPVAPA